MQENWVKIEYIFRNSGIYFELKGGLYLCLIEGRYFYYSPNTGKWRMKGKRPWFASYCSPQQNSFIENGLAGDRFGGNEGGTRQKTPAEKGVY